MSTEVIGRCFKEEVNVAVFSFFWAIYMLIYVRMYCVYNETVICGTGMLTSSLFSGPKHSKSPSTLSNVANVLLL